MTHHVVEPAPVQALAALFDDGLPTPAAGDTLPPLWHWVALARWAPYSATGEDGHPRPLDLPEELRGHRRMFAGGRVWFHRPLHLGERVETREEIVSSVPKQGGSGDFVLVTVRSEVLDESGALAVEETRDLVYRDAPRSATSAAPGKLVRREIPPAGPRLLDRTGTEWNLQTDPVALMRFSSATANAHRIHYDWVHATQTEGYPDLVVHGPLMTLALVEVARLDQPDLRVTQLEHRNSRPLFCGQPARVHTTEDSGSTGVVIDLRLAREGATLASVRLGTVRPS